MKLGTLTGLLLFFGCSSNLPYIDIDDVSNIKSGMNKSSVENILGYPIKISVNPDGEVWLYEYRELENSRLEYLPPVKGNNPQIVGSPTDFYCIFNDEKLTDWGSCFDGCGSESTQVKNAGILNVLNKYKWPIIIGGALILIKSMSNEEDEFEECPPGYFDDGMGGCTST